VSATPFRPDEFSPLERAALAHWRTPPPPADFAERVLARTAAEAAAPSPHGRLAVAAFALIVLGGLLSFRTMLGGPAGMPGQERSGGYGVHDAGPGPEVSEDVGEDLRQAFDSVRGQAS
jgi:hypothetical protein